MDPNSHSLRPAPLRNRRADRILFYLSPFTFHLSLVRRAVSLLRPALSLLTSHLSLLTAAAVIAAAPHASAEDSIPPKLPLQDFFRNPQAAGYTLSDDGKFLAFLAPWQDRLNVWVESVDGGEAKRLTDVTDRDLAGVSWNGNDTVLFEKPLD